MLVGWRRPGAVCTRAGAVVLPADAQQAAAVDEVRAQRARLEAELSEENLADSRAFAARQLHGTGADLSLAATLERARVEMEQAEALSARHEPAELQRLQALATTARFESAEQQRQPEDDELIARARKRWARRLHDRVVSR